jgi:hypothetical protein
MIPGVRGFIPIFFYYNQNFFYFSNISNAFKLCLKKDKTELIIKN